jgi:hypothetical protein
VVSHFAEEPSPHAAAVTERSGFTADFSSVASRTVTDEDTLRRRLPLCLFGPGSS